MQSLISLGLGFLLPEGLSLLRRFLLAGTKCRARGGPGSDGTLCDLCRVLAILVFCSGVSVGGSVACRRALHFPGDDYQYWVLE